MNYLADDGTSNPDSRGGEYRLNIKQVPPGRSPRVLSCGGWAEQSRGLKRDPTEARFGMIQVSRPLPQLSTAFQTDGALREIHGQRINETREIKKERKNPPVFKSAPSDYIARREEIDIALMSLISTKKQKEEAKHQSP